MGSDYFQQDCFNICSEDMGFSRKPVNVCISLYGNPIHRGHIYYIKAAKKLGDYLYVIVNNDEQVKLKGSTPFMDLQERMEIISALGAVNLVVPSIDMDRSVCKTLEQLHKNYKIDIFANGGDEYSRENCPETVVCDKYGIKMVFGVGGQKIQSSSELLKAKADWELAKFRSIVNDVDMSNIPMDSTFVPKG